MQDQQMKNQLISAWPQDLNQVLLLWLCGGRLQYRQANCRPPTADWKRYKNSQQWWHSKTIMIINLQAVVWFTWLCISHSFKGLNNVNQARTSCYNCTVKARLLYNCEVKLPPLFGGEMYCWIFHNQQRHISLNHSIDVGHVFHFFPPTGNFQRMV